MKSIRIQITDELHDELKALSMHHGHLSALIRRGIRLVIHEEHDKLAKLSVKEQDHESD